MTERRLWTSQEDNIILKLVQTHGPKKWTEIALDMKLNYPHLARSSKQIRQRWYNHLDPDINRNAWTEQQQLIIFEAHKKLGSKWKQIAKLLVARTDNSIKNHFYSTLRRSLRRINKFLGFKNSTNQMRVLKPSILCKLIENGQNTEQFRTLIDCIFQFSKFKPNKATKTDEQYFIGNQKKLLKFAIQKLTEFNKKYNRNQTTNKKKLSKSSRRKISRHTNCSTEESQKQYQIKLQLQQNIFAQQQTSKGLQSNKQSESEQNNKFFSSQLFQNGWEQSNHNQFLNLLPQFENPDQEQELISIDIENKQQEIFL